MKKFYIILLGLALTSLSMSVDAQMAKADRLYEGYNFAEAIPYYSKLAAKNNKHLAYAYMRLGDCNRLTSNFGAAADWYAKAAAIDSTTPDLYFNYAQSLRSLGLYDDAATQFSTYARLNPADPRGNLFARYSSEVKNWPSPEFDYDLVNAEKINSPYSDFSPVYFNDGIVFTSDRMARTGEKKYGWTGAYYLDLFTAPLEKDGQSDKLFPGTPSLYASKINEAYHDGPATFSSDFKTIYFTRVNRRMGEIDSSRYYTNKLKIFSSIFDGEKWSDPMPFRLNSDNYSIGHPCLSSNGKVFYFVSDMPGGQGGTDIYKVEWRGDDWGPAENLGTSINTFGNEMFPFIYQDSVLYFSSNGLPGFGSLDIFKSTLHGSSWSQPENLKSPVNSPADDFGIIINANSTAGMLSSNREGGKGEDDIYCFTMKERAPDSVLIAGIVRDRESMAVIPNSTVFALNQLNGEVMILKTDAAGKYEYWAKPGMALMFKAMKNSYSPDCLSLATEARLTSDRMNAPDLLLGRFKVDQIFSLENIYYDFDKWNIRSDAQTELDKVVAFLNENPDITVELGSHTDSRGSFKYNERLSSRRAESAVAYIVSRGIDNNRITAKGYGEYQLVNSCSDGVKCSEEVHQLNRRTEIKITGIKEHTNQSTPEPLDMYKHKQKLNVSVFTPDFFSNCNPKDATSLK